jgi:hypothetical protein
MRDWTSRGGFEEAFAGSIRGEPEAVVTGNCNFVWLLRHVDSFTVLQRHIEEVGIQPLPHLRNTVLNSA